MATSLLMKRNKLIRLLYGENSALDSDVSLIDKTLLGFGMNNMPIINGDSTYPGGMTINDTEVVTIIFGDGSDHFLINGTTSRIELYTAGGTDAVTIADVQQSVVIEYGGIGSISTTTKLSLGNEASKAAVHGTPTIRSLVAVNNQEPSIIGSVTRIGIADEVPFIGSHGYIRVEDDTHLIDRMSVSDTKTSIQIKQDFAPNCICPSHGSLMHTRGVVRSCDIYMYRLL